ncbi:MAG: SDR family oxidoreductase [Vicinamibacterales bacterium]
MKVFLTGVDGYIGSLLAPYLIERGHAVLGLDTGFYREGWLYSPRQAPEASPPILSKDLRHVQADDLAGCHVVVHLAELSNDPLGELQPAITHAINHEASVRLASLAKGAGVSRFVYASSCAVYGAGRDEILTEESAPNPQTAYARCKVLVERDLAALADNGFSPVCLRNATAFGASPRMRFDIVLNNLAGLARTTGRITLTSDGTPWRPLVHALDICRAIACAIEAPAAAVHAQTFNVGDNAQNYQVRDIAAIVSDAFAGCRLTVGADSGDRRSYRVSFDKIHRDLPGFRCEWDARRGAAQLHDLFERIDLSAERFQFRSFTRLDALKYLLRTHQLDAELFWAA